MPGPLAIEVMDRIGDVLYNLYGSTEVAWATIAVHSSSIVFPQGRTSSQGASGGTSRAAPAFQSSSAATAAMKASSTETERLKSWKRAAPRQYSTNSAASSLESSPEASSRPAAH